MPAPEAPPRLRQRPGQTAEAPEASKINFLIFSYRSGPHRIHCGREFSFRVCVETIPLMSNSAGRVPKGSQGWVIAGLGSSYLLESLGSPTHAVTQSAGSPNPEPASRTRPGCRSAARPFRLSTPQRPSPEAPDFPEKKEKYEHERVRIRVSRDSGLAYSLAPPCRGGALVPSTGQGGHPSSLSFAAAASRLQLQVGSMSRSTAGILARLTCAPVHL